MATAQIGGWGKKVRHSGTTGEALPTRLRLNKKRACDVTLCPKIKTLDLTTFVWVFFLVLLRQTRVKITHRPSNWNTTMAALVKTKKKKGAMARLWPPGADGCHSTPSLQFYERPRCGCLFGCLMCHLHRAEGARQEARHTNWQREHGDFFFVVQNKKPTRGLPNHASHQNTRKTNDLSSLRWLQMRDTRTNLGGKTTKSANSDRSNQTAGFVIAHFVSSTQSAELYVKMDYNPENN